MIRIHIGEDRREWSARRQIEEDWINRQINGRREDGLLPSVRVAITLPGIDVALAAPTPSGGGGGGRLPNPREREVFALWRACGLTSRDFAGGKLVAFLKRVFDRFGD